MKPKTEKICESFLLSPLNQNVMNTHEMSMVRGGRRLCGPGQVRESDIEVPDLNFTGPGGVKEDDLEQPDLNSTLSRGIGNPTRMAARIFGI